MDTTPQAGEVDRVGALIFRWSARLSAQIDLALTATPDTPADAVTRAWAHTARALPEVRREIDAQAEHPSSPAMARMIVQARLREHARLQLASQGVPGAEIERSARARLRVVRRPSPRPASLAEAPTRLVRRLRALLAA